MFSSTVAFLDVSASLDETSPHNVANLKSQNCLEDPNEGVEIELIEGNLVPGAGERLRVDTS